MPAKLKDRPSQRTLSNYVEAHQTCMLLDGESRCNRYAGKIRLARIAGRKAQYWLRRSKETEAAIKKGKHYGNRETLWRDII